MYRSQIHWQSYSYQVFFRLLVTFIQCICGRNWSCSGAQLFIPVCFRTVSVNLRNWMKASGMKGTESLIRFQNCPKIVNISFDCTEQYFFASFDHEQWFLGLHWCAMSSFQVCHQIFPYISFTDFCCKKVRKVTTKVSHIICVASKVHVT